MAFAVAGSASACSGGCRKSTPYVPFLDDSGAAPVRDGDIASIDASPDATKGPHFQVVRASLAPPGSARWALEGLEFDAPQGSVIVAAIARDLDGDQQRDVAAYVQPAGGGGGELRFFRGDGKGGVLAGKALSGITGAPEIALPAPCVGKPSMTLVGPHTISLDLRGACGEAAPTARRVVVAAFAPTPSIRWSARIAEPPAGWSFAVDIEALDRDGDGIDDPTFVLALEGGGPPYEPGDRVSAKLRYWDRPAGLSRDRTEPEGSFQWIAQGASARAAKKTSAVAVAAIVRRLRLLHAAICREGGAPWLEIAGEHGLECGSSRGLEEAAAAEVRAALATGDVIVAIAARERIAGSPAAKTTKTRAEVDKAILAAAPSIWGSVRELKALPSTPSKGAPAWGALAFDKSGNVLVRTATSVMRVDGSTYDESEATDVSSWPWEVTYSGKDARLSAIVDACEQPYLAARLAGHDVPTGATLLPLPMLPPLTSHRCAGGSSPSLPASPVAWGTLGLYTLVQHEPVIVPAQVLTPSGARATGTLPAPAVRVEGPYVLGSPRSPSATYLVVPTRFGVVRRDESAPSSVALVRAKDLEGLYGALRECAISDSGTRIACVREAKAIMIDTASTAPAAPVPGGEDASP